ncbi:MAG: hypothetical protein K2M34_00275 [Alphaproteobacteria bacterium]|nr:hypothetical protein [Alphaproteobacteria bacterium]
MQKGLLLCGVVCLGLIRPAFADWITCQEAVKDWGIIDFGDVASQCGGYSDGCYVNTSSGTIDCNHVASCSCPSGYSGTCTGTNYSTCYKTCSEKCNSSLSPTGCPANVPCADWFGVDNNTTCSTGRQYYGSSTCTSTGTCACRYDIPENYAICPEGYRDCGNTYNKSKDGEEVCCKIPAAGTYVKVAKGGTVSCVAGNYCPGGTEVFYGSTGGMFSCPGTGSTSKAGKSAITDCYLPSGTSFSDSTGSGVYTADCYYQK